jgi:hypothetical protein
LSAAARARETALEDERQQLAEELARVRDALARAQAAHAQALREPREGRPAARTGTGPVEAEGDEVALVPKALREALVKQRAALEQTRRGGNT